MCAISSYGFPYSVFESMSDGDLAKGLRALTGQKPKEKTSDVDTSSSSILISQGQKEFDDANTDPGDRSNGVKNEEEGKHYTGNKSDATMQMEVNGKSETESSHEIDPADEPESMEIEDNILVEQEEGINHGGTEYNQDDEEEEANHNRPELLQVYHKKLEKEEREEGEEEEN